ncbi:MAG: hemolysin family protein, partial [Culicoidibacterales bacterium]
AREIMTPRPNVYAIDINEPFSEYIDELITNQYSRVPVYDEEIDNIIGILYIKDILIAARKVGFEQIDVRALLQQALFVPERKKIDELFKELQAQKKHMAILVDEYGGFSGIVTLEDLIEEVMGEIEDEYDEDLVPIRKINETTYILDGLVPVHEVVEELELQLPTDSPDFDTISGFLVHLLGYIPQENSTEVIEYNNLIFTIKKIVDKRIATVELQINQIDK